MQGGHIAKAGPYRLPAPLSLPPGLVPAGVLVGVRHADNTLQEVELYFPASQEQAIRAWAEGQPRAFPLAVRLSAPATFLDGGGHGMSRSVSAGPGSLWSRTALAYPPWGRISLAWSGRPRYGAAPPGAGPDYADYQTALNERGSPVAGQTRLISLSVRFDRRPPPRTHPRKRTVYGHRVPGEQPILYVCSVLLGKSALLALDMPLSHVIQFAHHWSDKLIINSLSRTFSRTQDIGHLRKAPS